METPVVLFVAATAALYAAARAWAPPPDQSTMPAGSDRGRGRECEPACWMSIEENPGDGPLILACARWIVILVGAAAIAMPVPVSRSSSCANAPASAPLSASPSPRRHKRRPGLRAGRKIATPVSRFVTAKPMPSMPRSARPRRSGRRISLARLFQSDSASAPSTAYDLKDSVATLLLPPEVNEEVMGVVVLHSMSG